MKKCLTLIAIMFAINVAKAQRSEKFNPKFIYEKLIDIYHNSLSVNIEEYFSQFGYDLVSNKDLPNGDIMHRAVPDAGVNHFNLSSDEIINGWGNQELSFTTHSISNSLYITVESRYSTGSSKEYNELLKYILGVGYKLTSDASQTETQTYKMDNLRLVFQKQKHESKPYKIIYTIIPN